MSVNAARTPKLPAFRDMMWAIVGQAFEPTTRPTVTLVVMASHPDELHDPIVVEIEDEFTRFPKKSASG